MPDETKHGASNPPGENPAGPGSRFQCSEFEALLSDAIEGHLTGGGKDSFEAHRHSCSICGPMFAEVEAGRLWLRSLEPVEPPAYLVSNILAATSGVVSTRVAPAGITAVAPFGERLREWWDSWFTPVSSFVRQPQFVMSFGMIFFTFSLVLSTAGFKASDVAKIDLRPSAIRHAYIDAQIKVVQYYDNIRFVYEIESRVRELKRATTPAEPAPAPKKDNRTNNNTSGQPDQKQDRNYSEQQSDEVLANLQTNDVFTSPGRQSDVDWLMPAASHEPRGLSEQQTANLEGVRDILFARSPRLVTGSYSYVQPPVPLTTKLTMTRRFV
jgi:hypothetical protein